MDASRPDASHSLSSILKDNLQIESKITPKNKGNLTEILTNLKNTAINAQTLRISMAKWGQVF